MTADQTRYLRVGGAAGIIAMALLLVGFFLPGSPPKADDSLQAVTSYLVDKRGSILAGDFLIGLGFALFVVWLSALRGRLEAGERDRALPRVAFAGGVIAAALTFVGAALSAGTVFEAAGLGDQTLNRALFDMSTDMFTIGGFAIALFFGAASLSARRTGALPGWASTTGLAVAALNLVSTVAIFVSSGFFASGGAFGFIAFLPSVAWIIAVSVVLLRSGKASPAAAPGTG